MQVSFFFDEIQQVPDWERFIRRVLDTETRRESLHFVVRTEESLLCRLVYNADIDMWTAHVENA